MTHRKLGVFDINLGNLYDALPNGLRSRSTALGQTWTLFGSRENSEPEKYSTRSVATNPTCAVKALMGTLRSWLT